MDPFPSTGTFQLARLVLVFLCTAAFATARGQVTVETFDLEGPVTTVTEFVEYPGVTERNVFQTLSFRPDGTALERIYLGYSYMDGSLQDRQVTTYDAAGKPLASITMDSDGNHLAQIVVRYDDQGRLLEEASYDAGGTERRRVTYARNGGGQVVAREVYVDGVLHERTEIDYDAQDRVREERTYEDGRLIEIEAHTDPGRASEVVVYDDEGQVRSSRLNMASALGTERMEVSDGDGNLQFVSTWSYDPSGLLLERSVVDGAGEGEVYTYAYTFDTTGNWIRMVVTEAIGGMEPTTYEIRDREITYD